MFAGSQFVVLALPSTADTAKLMGEREFCAKKRGAYLINIARGAVVDEIALISALERKLIGGACLDVFEAEPLPRSSPLWTLPDVDYYARTLPG